MSWIVRRLGDVLLRRFRPAHRFTDVGYEVMDLRATGGECYRGDSLEIALEASTDAHIAFVEDSIFPLFEDVAKRGHTAGGYVSLRFTAKSVATIAMQRWNPTCSIEIALLKGIQGNYEILGRLHDEAIRSGGTVHWGQRNTTTSDDVAKMYPHLAQWRAALTELGHTADDVFDNDFCRHRDLEPS